MIDKKPSDPPTCDLDTDPLLVPAAYPKPELVLLPFPPTEYDHQYLGTSIKMKELTLIVELLV